MNSTPTSPVCPDCGAALPADAPDALCAACLLRQALVSRTLDGDDSPSALPPPSPEEIAGKFPQFEITECLGRGGMGVVYKARQKSLDRWVAIKILAPERLGEETFAARFAREAATLAKLTHPNIVTVHDYGETAGLFYIVMEYIDGVNLRDLLRDGKLDPEQALAIVPPICDALQYAHDKGIVHRDIKPENLLLDRDGRIKIADFGIATLIGTGAENTGTPPYMAPEQSGVSTDHRADIYALGVVLYEMLTGERPNQELVAPSKKVQIDVRLDEMVLRALDKNPELRYQSAGEFKTVVETMQKAAPSRAKPKPTRHFVWAAVATLLIILAVLVPIWFGQRDAGDGTDVAPPAVSRTAAAGQSESQQPDVHLMAEALRLRHGGKSLDAAAMLEKIVELTPMSDAAWYYLGLAKLESIRPGEAGSAFERALALQGEHGSAAQGLGQLHFLGGDHARAEAHLLKVADKRPLAGFDLARLYLLQAKFDLAEKWGRTVLESGWDDVVTKQMLAAARAKKLPDELRIWIATPPEMTGAASMSVFSVSDETESPDLIHCVDLAVRYRVQFRIYKELHPYMVAARKEFDGFRAAHPAITDEDCARLATKRRDGFRSALERWKMEEMSLADPLYRGIGSQCWALDFWIARWTSVDEKPPAVESAAD